MRRLTARTFRGHRTSRWLLGPGLACLLLTACSSDEEEDATPLPFGQDAEGVFADPCSVLDGSAIAEGGSQVASTAADLSSCEYTSDGQVVQVMLLSPLVDLEELLARSDCKPLQIPGSESVCAYPRPLSDERGPSGSSLVVRTSAGGATLTTTGEPIRDAELHEAATKIVAVLDA